MNTDILGHRGIRERGQIPENSQVAFSEAYKLGAHGIELDVFLTRDNKLVVFHDDTLDRMTLSTGDIREKTLGEVQALFLINEKNGQLTDHHAPTLDQVLKLVDKIHEEHPHDERAQNFKINIELKPMTALELDKPTDRLLLDHDAGPHLIKKNIVGPVIDLITSYIHAGHKQENFIISSFDMGTLVESREKAPQIHRRMLISNPEDPLERDWRHNIEQNQMEYKLHGSRSELWTKSHDFDKNWDPFFTQVERICQPSAANVNAHFQAHWQTVQPHSVALPMCAVTTDISHEILRRGADVTAWTCNEQNPEKRTAEELNHLIESLEQRQVTTVITDFPGQLSRLYQALKPRTVHQ